MEGIIKNIDRFFRLTEQGTSFKTELIVSLTAFVNLSYMLSVIPNILTTSGMGKGTVSTTLVLTSILGSIVMGPVANYPIALTPTLGSASFFTYIICQGVKISWEIALADMLAASLLFILIAIFKLREIVINTVPQDLKYAISARIRIFIAFIGLQNGKLIVSSDSSLVGLDSSSNPAVWIAVFGLLVTIVLMCFGVPGSVFIGMVVTAIFRILISQIPLPKEFISMPPSIAPSFGQAVTHLGNVNTVQMAIVVITFLLATFSDTVGTLIGMTQQAGLTDRDGKIPRIGRALVSDSIGMIISSIFDVSPLGTVVESSSGIAIGGRTGLTAIFVGFWFLITMFLSPSLTVIPITATAPALTVVGVLMVSNLAGINWDKFEIALSAFLIVLGISLTYLISDGLALGMITYSITMLAFKRGKEVSPIMYGSFFIFIIYLWIISI